MAAITGFNPLATTNAAGTFAVTSSGYIQGVFQDDPALRYQMAGGTLGPNETLPMWGGVLISETTSPVASTGTYPERSLGGYVTRATSYPTSLYTPSATAGIATGFSVFNQANAMLNWPQNPVPVALNGGQVNLIRFGCGLRLPVAASAALIDLAGNAIVQQVSWDLTAQQLVPYTPGYSQTNITNAVWANTNGGQTTFTTASDLTADLSAGDFITVAAVVNTGGTSTSAFNGEWQIVSVTTDTIVVSQPAASSPGTYASGGHVVAVTGGALPVKVIDVQSSGCMVVTYNATTGNCTWNRSGAAVLIQV
jgi:hypothetical protein